MTSRLFVAAPIADEWGDSFEEYTKTRGLPQGRAVPSENMHVTVYFLGDVREEKIPELQTALGAIKVKPFELSFDKITFGPLHGRNASMIWTLFKQHPLFLKLARSVADAAHPFIERDITKEAIPHITLSRLERVISRTSPLSRFNPPCPVLGIKQFGLYKSHLNSDGAVYKLVETYPLKSILIK